MRILFITEVPIDGTRAESSVRALSASLASMGHTVIITAGYESRKTSPNLPDGVFWDNVGYCYTGNNLTRRTLGHLRMRFFSLIHGLKGVSRYDIIYCRVPFGLDALVLKILARKPLIYSASNFAAAAREYGYNRIALFLTTFGEKTLAQRSNKIIAVTSGMKSYFIKNYQVPDSKVVIINNGANTDLFQPMDIESARAKIGLSGNQSLIGFIGTFAPLLGIEQLVECVPLVLDHYPEARFLLVGSGPLKPHIEKLIAQKNLNRAFILTGSVPHQMVPEHVNACDIMVAPFNSFRNEMLGVSPASVYEYMACGKPVVASDLPGLRECLGDTGAGTLVPPDDPVELAKAIIKLLGDKSLREEMGRRAREAAVEQYRWQQTAQRVAKVCESVLAERKEI